ncbi:MAG: hypothetical protein BHV69_10045 [Bacteroidales bacterium 52_46]|nr:MAG: hypothetical protein BHV69_10045 [Bacteroidales bacterium 52_46]
MNYFNFHNMDTLSKRQHCVIGILFVLGFLAVARAFGAAETPLNNTEWIKQTFLSLVVGAACFYAVYSLTKKWERKNKNIKHNIYE